MLRIHVIRPVSAPPPPSPPSPPFSRTAEDFMFHMSLEEGNAPRSLLSTTPPSSHTVDRRIRRSCPIEHLRTLYGKLRDAHGHTHPNKPVAVYMGFGAT